MLLKNNQCFSQTLKCINSLFISKYSNSLSSVNEKSVDVAIVGGGIIGYSTAYWLKRENAKLEIAIIEKDLSYEQCSAVLSVGGIRQQFSEPENIRMSMFCAKIFSKLDEYFSVSANESIDIQFVKRGYLILCSTGNSAVLYNNYNRQKKLGACVQMLSKTEIKDKWPWLNVEDIECGVHGTDNEGWFDPWLLLNAIKEKVNQMGVTCHCGTVKEFKGRPEKLDSVIIRNKNGDILEIKSNSIVNSTGCWASQIAVKAEQATGLSGFDYPLFIKKRKRYVYNFSVPKFPKGIFTPMIIDTSGLYFRRENNGLFLCGLSPEENKEPHCRDLDVDYEWFDENIWPKLFKRVHLMESLKVKSGWAGFYDYNTKDQNLIIGKHPAINNFYLCNGSSGHGIQHALAIGLANMELILYGDFKTINLHRFNYTRFINKQLIFEKNII